MRTALDLCGCCWFLTGMPVGKKAGGKKNHIQTQTVGCNNNVNAWDNNGVFLQLENVHLLLVGTVLMLTTDSCPSLSGRKQEIHCKYCENNRLLKGNFHIKVCLHVLSGGRIQFVCFLCVRGAGNTHYSCGPRQPSRASGCFPPSGLRGAVKSPLQPGAPQREEEDGALEKSTWTSDTKVRFLLCRRCFQTQLLGFTRENT